MKRQLVKLAVVLGVVAILMGVMAAPASALFTWCWTDPVVEIAGEVNHIDIGVPKGTPVDRSKFVVTIYVPKGVEAEIIDPQGTQVEIVEVDRPVRNGIIPVMATVLVPYKGFPVRVRVTDDDGKILAQSGGMAGKLIKVRWVLNKGFPVRVRVTDDDGKILAQSGGMAGRLIKVRWVLMDED